MYFSFDFGEQRRPRFWPATVSTFLVFVTDCHVAEQREFAGTDCVRMDRHTDTHIWWLSLSHRYTEPSGLSSARMP